MEGSGFVADIAVIIFAAGTSEFCYASSPRNTEITVTARNGHGETVARHRRMIKSHIHMSTRWMVQKWDTNGTLPVWYNDGSMYKSCNMVSTRLCVDQVCGESLIVAAVEQMPQVCHKKSLTLGN